MFGIRSVGRCSISMTKQIQPRPACFSSSSLLNDSSSSNSNSNSSNPSGPPDLFQKRSAGRGQKIQSMKNEIGGVKRFTDNVVANPQENHKPSFKPIGSVLSALNQKPQGPPSAMGAGRGRPTGTANASPSAPSQRKPIAPMDSRFRDVTTPYASDRAPRDIQTVTRKPSGQRQFPSPDGRFPSGTRAGTPSTRPFTPRGPGGPGSWSPRGPANALMQFGKPPHARSGAPGAPGAPGGWKPLKRQERGKDQKGRGRRPNESLLEDSLFDAPEHSADAEVTLKSYLKSEENHPLGIHDYYTPREILPFKTMRLAEDEEYEYPTSGESLAFGGSESFTLGEVAHHGIDWNNFDQIPRVSNEKYFVNIEPLEEANKTKFKTPEEFLATVPISHEHYKTLLDVYTLVDRNPWYNNSQKVNLLVQVSQEGVSPA